MLSAQLAYLLDRLDLPRMSNTTSSSASLTTPISLLTIITETKLVSPGRIAARSSSTLTIPVWIIQVSHQIAHSITVLIDG